MTELYPLSTSLRLGWTIPVRLRVSCGEADVDHAVAAHEPEEGVAAAAVLEVALECQGEAGMAVRLRVVHQAHDQVVDVAAVLPVPLAPHARDPVRAQRAGGVMDAA